MLELLRGPAARIEEALGLRSGQGLRIMLWTHALMVGLAQMTSREETSLRLLKKYPELQISHLNFSKDFETALAAMLAGSAALLV